MSDFFPPAGFHFLIKFGFLESESNDAKFLSVSGLNAEVGTEEVAEGGENRFSYRLPTRARYSNLILKRGLYVNSRLIDWCKKSIENFIFEPTDVVVSLLNEAQEQVGDSFNFFNAWPVRWQISDFNAQENSLVIETLELSYNFFTRARLNKG